MSDGTFLPNSTSSQIVQTETSPSTPRSPLSPASVIISSLSPSPERSGSSSSSSTTSLMLPLHLLDSSSSSLATPPPSSPLSSRSPRVNLKSMRRTKSTRLKKKSSTHSPPAAGHEHISPDSPRSVTSPSISASLGGESLVFPQITEYKSGTRSSKSRSSKSATAHADMFTPIVTGSSSNVDIFSSSASASLSSFDRLPPPPHEPLLLPGLGPSRSSSGHNQVLDSELRMSLSRCTNGQGQSLLEAAFAKRDLRKFQLLLGTLMDPLVATRSGPLLIEVLAPAQDFETRSFLLSLLVAITAWFARTKRQELSAITGRAARLEHKQRLRERVSSRLQGIKSLALSGLSIEAVPKAVWLLAGLEFLDLSRNDLASVPGGVRCLAQLAELDLSNNRALEYLPVALGSLRRLGRLRLAGCPVSSIPESVQFQYVSSESATLTAHHVKDYLQSLAAQTKWKLVKLMVLGQEGVGKTTLVRALSGLNIGRTGPTGDTLSTTGIDVAEWKAGKHTQFSVWDFGGQSVFYPTHQFFLTNNSVYVLVFDLSQPISQSRIDYWLKKIQIMTTAETPIVVIGTHADDPSLSRQGIDATVDKVQRKCARYPQVLAVLPVSCKRKADVKAIRKTLEKVAAENEALSRRQVPRGWTLVPGEIAKLKKQVPYLPLQELKDTVFTACGVEPHDTRQALRQFHDAGVLVYFDDSHMELSKLVIIDPQWLSKVMASIITFEHNYAAGAGILERAHLRQIWSQYPKPLWSALLALLERFEVAYLWLRPDGCAPCVIIPSLLPPARPASFATLWPDACPYGYREYGRDYQFQFVPLGFYARLFMRLVRTSGIQLTEGLGWVSGAVIRYGEHLALIESNEVDYRIHITVRERNCLASNNKNTNNNNNNKDNNKFSPATQSLSSSTGFNDDMNKQRAAMVQKYLMAGDDSDSISDKDFDANNEKVAREEGAPNFLRLIVETVEPLLEYSYPNLSETTIRTLPCVHCLGSEEPDSRRDPFMFSFQECYSALHRGVSYVYCCGLRTRPVFLTALAPDLSFADLPVIDPEEYEVLEQLGAGGFGTVYKARMRGSGDVVAIKELNLEGTTTTTATTTTATTTTTTAAAAVISETERLQKFTDFQREVHMMAALQNDYIVQLYGVSLQPRLRMVIEFVAGRDLYHLIHDPATAPEQFGWAQQLQVAYDIACGMDYLHTRNPPVAHADLRSPNIFLAIERCPHTRRWTSVRAKVADFGLSRRVFSHTQGFLNTWQWMAPEVLDTTREHFDERIDTYSFAIVMWETVSRAYPFEEFKQFMVKRILGNGEEREFLRERDIKAAIVADGLRPTPQGPDAYRQLMADCWNAEPHYRPAFSAVRDRLHAMFPADAPPVPMPPAPRIDVQFRSPYQAPQVQAAVDGPSSASSSSLSRSQPQQQPPTLTASLPLPVRVAVACAESHGEHVWIAGKDSQQVVAVNVATRTIAHTVTLPAPATALASVDCHVWAGCANGQISLLPWAGRGTADVVTTFAPPNSTDRVTALCWAAPKAAPAEDTVWVCYEESCRLVIINPATLARIGEMSLEPGPVGAIFHNENVWVAAAGTMQVFAAATRQHLFQVAYSASGNFSSMFSNGDRVWSGSTDGAVTAWTSRGQLIRTVRSSRGVLTTILALGSLVYAAGVEKNIVLVNRTEIRTVLDLANQTEPVVAIMPGWSQSQPLMISVWGQQVDFWALPEDEDPNTLTSERPPVPNVQRSYKPGAVSTSKAASSAVSPSASKKKKFSFFHRKS